MKYRSDFVTNSSSSSYVIAVKNDITEEILRALITKEFVIEELYLDDEDDYDDEDEDTEDGEAKTSVSRAETYIEDVIKFVIKKEYGYDKPLVLDNWNVFQYTSSDECNEDDRVFQILAALKDNDFIKSSSIDC